MSGPPVHLTSWREAPFEFWKQCLEDTLAFAGGAAPPQLGKHIGLLFLNPSLRTRASMEVAAGRLGCRVTTLAGDDSWKLAWETGEVMDGDAAEHVVDAARVLSGYFDVLGVRSFAPLPNPSDVLTDTPVARIARHATIPVINLESAAFHPCQALADAATLYSHFGSDLSGLRFVLSWACHPRALPMAVPQSTLLMAARLGAHVTVANPPGFSLPDRLMAEAGVLAKQHGGTVESSDDMDDAVRGAHAVYAKSWTPADIAATDDAGTSLRLNHRDWRVTRKHMDATDRGVFMHCLPVRRNVVVDDEVIDGPASIVQHQARMRVDANIAILNAMLGIHDAASARNR